MVGDTLENTSLPAYRIIEGFIYTIDILHEKLTPQTGDWVWKKSLGHYASGVGDFMWSMSSLFKNF